MRSSLIAIVLISAAPVCWADEVVSRVTVLDQQSREVRTIADEAELKSFADQWDQKQEVKPAAPPSWTYNLDLSRGHTHGARWLYDGAGLTALLAVKAGPIYRIAEPSKFNDVLGIPNRAASGTGGVGAD